MARVSAILLRTPEMFPDITADWITIRQRFWGDGAASVRQLHAPSGGWEAAIMTVPEDLESELRDRCYRHTVRGCGFGEENLVDRDYEEMVAALESVLAERMELVYDSKCF